MQTQDEEQSAPTETTSDDLSTTGSMTKQSLAELKSRLAKLNRLIVETAMEAVEDSEYATPEFRRRMMKKQKKHTMKMLADLPTGEMILLLNELRSREKLIDTPSNSPDSSDNSEESTPQ